MKLFGKTGTKRMNVELNKSRYARQIQLECIGERGQLAWRNSTVLLVGVGGLGSISASYLCAAGIGKLKIVDPDLVSESNLQRQILYNTSEIGKPKVECALERLKALNPETEIEKFFLRFDPTNAVELARGCNIIVDGTDGKAVRYLMDTVSVGLGIPYAYASIHEFEAQVSLLNANEHSPIYRDLFQEDQPAEQLADQLVEQEQEQEQEQLTQQQGQQERDGQKEQEQKEQGQKVCTSNNAATSGVVGPLPGAAASWQTWEVLSYLCGIKGGLQGKLKYFSLLSGQEQMYEIKAEKENRMAAEADFKRIVR